MKSDFKQWVERDPSGKRITLWMQTASGTSFRRSVDLESAEGDVLVELEAVLAASHPAPASQGVEGKALTWIDVLREWFGGERYARDYEYLDANYRQHAERVVAFAAAQQPAANEGEKP